MCTAITLQSIQGGNFFGRTMDFSYPIEPDLYIMPKHYQWESLVSTQKYTSSYAFIAIGQESEGMLSFFDGINEQGFSVAVLYFEGYADFDLPENDKKPIASLDLLHYLLGHCHSVKDLKHVLKDVRIVGRADPVTQRVAPLHWITTDRSGKSVVIEQTKAGLEIIDNPIGVMTNSPNFNWHLTNLRNYMTLTTTQPHEVHWGDVSLKPFGQATGTTNLPGGFTSPERFVRTSFLKTHIQTPEDQDETILAFFHLMKSVFIPKGIVLSHSGNHDYTKYIAVMDTNKCAYYFKSYENDQIITASLWDYNLHVKHPIILGSIVQHTTLD